MTAFDFLLYLAAGRLVTWMLQIAGLLRPLWRAHPFLTEFAECDLCLGFWVYLALALLWRPEKSLNLWPYWVEMVVLAMLSALLAHLLRLGWQSKFGVTVVT